MISLCYEKDFILDEMNEKKIEHKNKKHISRALLIC